MEEGDDRTVFDHVTEADDSTSTTDDEQPKTDTEISIFDFEERSWKTDFILNVDGTKLYVAKNILALGSPVFDRMFQADFKESSSEELTLPGKKVHDVKEFLRCIYPNTLTQISFENALTLLPLLEEYQVLHLKTRCENVLIERIGKETPVIELYQRLKESDMYNLRNLRQKCITLASNKPQNELDEAKRECPPPAKDLVEILENVTTVLRANIAELKTDNDKLSNDIDKLKSDAELGQQAKELKESNSKMSKDIDVWTSYCSGDIKKSKELFFEENLKWKEMHFVVHIPVASRYCSSSLIEIWGVPLRISTSTYTRNEFDGKKYTGVERLQIRMASEEVKQVFCKVNTRCDLVSRQPHGENVSFFFKKDFTGTLDMSLKDISSISNFNAGFVRDGEISLILHVYMSEPNIGL